MNEIDFETKELMVNHGLDRDDAEKVQELIDNEGLDENEALEIYEAM